MKVESNIQHREKKSESEILTQNGKKMNYFWQFLGIIKYVKASYRIQLGELATDVEILKRLSLKFTFTG